MTEITKNTVRLLFFLANKKKKKINFKKKPPKIIKIILEVASKSRVRSLPVQQNKSVTPKFSVKIKNR